MLTPTVIATWISFCTPWAEPRLLAALVEAGSGGEPFLITSASGARFVGKTHAEAIAHFRQIKNKEEHFLGLTQAPVSQLRALGISPETALDKCGSLEAGHHLLAVAHEAASKAEKSPWKTISVTYSYFRNRQLVVDSPFAKKATDYLMKTPAVAPAAINSPVRHAVMAEWSAGLAARQGSLFADGKLTALLESEALTRWARRQF